MDVVNSSLSGTNSYEENDGNFTIFQKQGCQ